MFLAADGDNIGSEIEKYIILCDSEALSRYWKDVSRIVASIERKLRKYQAKIILCGGDSILAELQDENAQKIVRELFSKIQHITFSVGTGTTMREAFVALKIAKASGKKCWVDYRDLSKIQMI